MEGNTVFLSKLEDLVKEIITQHDIPFYRIEAIMETHVHATGTKNVPVIRIVSYFEDTVAKVSAVLLKEFDLEVVRSTDKNNTWLESFSSPQVHYRASFKENRSQLIEYRRWNSEHFEIRVCSMLQDAWHGMEKELKTNTGSIPDEVKRDFYRIGAFLEMADIEFLKIKELLAGKNGSSHSAYAPSYPPEAPAAISEPINQISSDGGADVTTVAPEYGNSYIDVEDATITDSEHQTINSTIEVIPVVDGYVSGSSLYAEDSSNNTETDDDHTTLTDASLREYVSYSSLLREVDRLIADRAGARVNEDIDIEGDVERLKFLDIFTVQQLHEKIAENKHDIVAFAEKWIGKDNGGSFDSGICLFYLEYMLVGKRNDPAFAVEYVLKFISDNDYSARYIIPTYNAIKQPEQAAGFSPITLN